MTILVSGASGLIGSALLPFLAGCGHETILLTRPNSTAGSVATWDPAAGKVDLSRIRSLDAIVHLAGENIAGRWTPEKKARIRESRVRGTRLLAEALTALPQPPKVFICASGVGYYGSRGAEVLDEQSPSGTGFLAEVCRDWEKATLPVAQKGIRVVNLRIGMVLADGGALKKMLPAFRLGLGGKVGDGRQYWSWIALEDLLSIIGCALSDDRLEGPINTVSPHPVTCREFTKTLGTVLRRPAVFPVPAFAVKLLFGQMGAELLLSSTRVKPAILERTRFGFRFPGLDRALRQALR